MLTAGELKVLLENLPDDTPVGVAGHFGEFHPFHWRPKIRICKNDPENPWTASVIDHPRYQALVFDAIDVGPEPER